DEAPLAAIVQREQCAFAFAERADMTIVVARRGLQLDDIGAQVRQQRGAIGTRQDTGQVQYGNTLQRFHGRTSSAGATGDAVSVAPPRSVRRRPTATALKPDTCISPNVMFSLSSRMAAAPGATAMP